MENYYHRIMDDVLKDELNAFGGVLLVGPKWCGKTTTAARLAKSIVYMQNPDNKESYIRLAKIQPSLLLEGEKPRLIDEWQMAPELWDAIRFDIDQKGKEGLYILTGSTIVDENSIAHTGAGRITRLLMRTMSLYESNDSNGSISLKELFLGNHDISAISPLSIRDISQLIVRGGWPRTLGKPIKIAKKQISGYCNTIANSDIRSVDGVARDEKKTKAIMRSLARHIGTQAPNTTILSDIKSNNESMSIDTLTDYINTLEKLFVIEDMPAWSPQLRSRTAIRTSNTRHYVDPAIAARMLDAGPDDLLFDLNTMGFLFESLVVRDLRIYSQQINGRVYHYRDRNGLEIDAIITLDNGQWGGIEVKLGHDRIDEGAQNLLKFSQIIDDKKMNKPSFLMVVTGTEFAYKRDDGVLVVPIGCLKH
ncbi:MAG: ATP-binding protein [Candidatus Izemoplasmataceae bacterium]